MGNEPKVVVNNLYKQFGDLKVLDDVNFTIGEGEFLSVVGPTGSGKTTFLNLLVRLLEPTSGEILMDNEPVNPKKHNISFVFQQPSAFPWMTVEDNIQYGLRIKKYDEKTIEERTNSMLNLLGLEDSRKKFPHELSTSTEQRIVIGRSFATHPDLLLMDEPYGQMDLKMRYYLEDQVLKLWKETGSTVVFITHNVEEAIYLGDRVLILSQKPASVKEILDIDLPRPRDIASKEFVELREYVTDQIKWW